MKVHGQVPAYCFSRPVRQPANISSASENVRRFVAGEPLLRVVDKGRDIRTMKTGHVDGKIKSQCQSAEITSMQRNGKIPKGKKVLVRQGDPLPSSILWQYEGKHIIFSHEEQRVIGVGDTHKEAFAQAKDSGIGGLWHYAYADRSDEFYI
jgi:hypothetical protein